MGEEVRTGVSPEDTKRETGCSSGVSGRHAGVTVLLQLDGPGMAMLDGVPKPVEGAHPGIPTPGEDQAAGATHPDQLVVDHVRGHPGQCQFLLLLSDHLVAGGERDQMGEALHRHGRPIRDQVTDGIGE